MVRDVSDGMGKARIMDTQKLTLSRRKLFDRLSPPIYDAVIDAGSRGANAFATGPGW